MTKLSSRPVHASTWLGVRVGVGVGVAQLEARARVHLVRGRGRGRGRVRGRVRLRLSSRPVHASTCTAGFRVRVWVR